MIIAIRTYINYLNIEISIQNVKEETNRLTLQKNYEQKFLIPYDKSYRSDVFSKHENNILDKDEFIIQFQEPKIVVETATGSQVEETLTPQEARKHFLYTVRNKN